MAIRRFRDHVAEHNWFAVAVDVGIVVLGVFIGLQVNNWNQARLEARQGREYRERLIRELDFNARQYAEQQHYYGRVLDHGLKALAGLSGGQSARDFLINAYQLSQIDTTSPKSYIYDEMVSSGLVSRLGSEELQETASDYYLNIAATDRTIREVLPYRTTIRQLMPLAVQSAIRDHCGDRYVFYRRRVVGVSLPDQCEVSLDAAAANEAARAIRSTPGLREEMTRYVASVDEKLDVLKMNLLMTRRFVRDLEAAR